MSGYELIRGLRRDSKIIWVPTDKCLYVKKESRRGCDEYICYQTVLGDPKKKNILNVPMCTCRVKIDIATGNLLPRKKSHTVHNDHELLYKDMKSKNKITDDVIAISEACKGLSIKVPINDIFTCEIATRPLGESKLRLQKMKRNLSRYANEKYPANPDSFAAVSDAFKNPNILNEYGLNMRNNERFYQCTVINEPIFSFTLFASIEIIRMIKEHVPPNNRRYLMDGTFSIRPISPYYQVLVIYIEYNNDVIPFIYAVMSNKCTEAYEAILNYIEYELFAMEPASFMADFEGGIRKAIQKCYPSAKLFGCWYHFSAAVRRRMTKNGLRKLIKDNPEALTVYLKLLRLPLLPPNCIVEGYNLIVKEARSKRLYSKFQNLFLYFEKFWLSMNEKNSLSVAWLNMRTTSSLEAFNAVLKRSIAQRFNFFKFVARLKFHECRKAERMHNLVHDELSELHYARRKIKDQEREVKIQKVTTMLTEGKLTIMEFLQAMSTEDEIEISDCSEFSDDENDEEEFSNGDKDEDDDK